MDSGTPSIFLGQTPNFLIVELDECLTPDSLLGVRCKLKNYEVHIEVWNLTTFQYMSINLSSLFYL